MKKAIRYVEYHLKPAISLIGWLGLFMLLPYTSFTQNEDWKSVLSDRLESKGEVAHLHLVGYFDDIVFAEMFFAYDSLDWTGILSFPDADLEFLLEGYQLNDELFFEELGAEGMHTGYWTIRKNLNEYIGKWYNPDKSMDFEFVLYDEFWNPDFRKNYHKKIVSYTGIIDTIPYQFEITRQHDKPVQMEWFNVQSWERELVSWKCMDPFCKRFIVSLPKDLRKEVEADVKMEAEENGDIFKLSENESIAGDFERVSEHTTALKSALSLTHKVIVEYPVLHSRHGSKTMDRVSSRILDSLIVQIESIEQSEYPIDSRWKLFAHAWFDVYYWDENYISGKWVIQRNWTEEKWAVSMNYSHVDNQFFEISDQFKSEFDIEYFLDHYAQTGIRELPEYKDHLIRNKLLKADFKYLNFCKSGILMSSDFDTLFGAFHLMISYDEIEPYLRKRSDIKKMLLIRKDD